MRARRIPDVVLVEEENRPELRVLKRRPGLVQPLAPEPREVDALLPVDGHRGPARGDVHRWAPPLSFFSMTLWRACSRTRCSFRTNKWFSSQHRAMAGSYKESRHVPKEGTRRGRNHLTTDRYL